MMVDGIARLVGNNRVYRRYGVPIYTLLLPTSLVMVDGSDDGGDGDACRTS